MGRTDHLIFLKTNNKLNIKLKLDLLRKGFRDEMIKFQNEQVIEF